MAFTYNRYLDMNIYGWIVFLVFVFPFSVFIFVFLTTIFLMRIKVFLFPMAARLCSYLRR